ncbi:MAG: sel1 repeat family protein [Alphaproteobacteria bacterium]|nr:sel1 repeat family protein [Alphaproteobacteria bacterium]
MKILSALVCLSLIGFSPIVAAQFDQDVTACEPTVLASEEEYNPTIYDECGFNDIQTAMIHWAPLIQERQWKNASFELYKRHTNYPGIKSFLYKAAELGHSTALMMVGDEQFDAGKIPEAMRYYNAAIRGDLPEEDQGKITGRLALLYADPKSNHYDTQKAVPLLQRAALQRHALSNNIMGALSLFGMYNVKQNPEESFKYFWRAILLGCPAAEENLGLFQLGRQNKIDLATLKSEVMKRTFSCDKVEDTASIKPYHLSFTTQECADINYYAERLVDTSLPFTGKEECAFSADMSQMADFLSK